MLQDAQAGQFDTVLAEALDRISRDQADVATLFNHLEFVGVPIVTLAEGEISELHVGLKGTMNTLLLKDLAARTHRGLRGRVEAGKSGGRLFACSNHISKGTCDNSRTIAREELERRVLTGLKDRMMAPEVAAEAMRAYAEETNRLNRECLSNGDAGKAELRKIERNWRRPSTPYWQEPRP